MNKKITIGVLFHLSKWTSEASVLAMPTKGTIESAFSFFCQFFFVKASVLAGPKQGIIESTLQNRTKKKKGTVDSQKSLSKALTVQKAP